MDLSSLPEEMLLYVFSKLDCEDLLKVRSVCRQWRALAGSRAVWKHLTIKDDNPTVKALLRLAPCIDVLDIRDCLFPSQLLPAGVLQAACTTKCAARELRLAVKEGRTQVALEVLLNQINLRRLRRLEINFGYDFGTLPVGEPDMFLAQVDVAGLEELAIGNGTDDPLPAMDWHPSLPGSTSLKRLRYRSDFHDPLLGSLLAAHALTLEHVQLLDSNSCSEAHVRQLNECAALRRLEVPLVPALARLDTLRLQDLVVDVQDASAGGSSRDVEALAASLAPAFRNACHLRRLVLLYGWVYHPERGAVGMQLVEALASSGRAALRTLELGVTAINCELPLRLLAPSLPGLRHLHTLRLPSLPPEELQEAVSPHSAPSLRLLDVTDSLCRDEAPCAVPALRRLLLHNPLLHFRAHHSSDRHNCDKHSRDLMCCRKSWHPLFAGSDGLCHLASAFYTHFDIDRCEWHMPGVDWVFLF